MIREITIHFEGRPLSARYGESVAATLLRHEIRMFRDTPIGNRGPFCGIGLCHECGVQIVLDDASPVVLRACVTPVSDGMKITRAPATGSEEQL